MSERRLELLAPARDLACGRAAIDHGADAVYIGGPLFGARAAAANRLEDIEQLVRYAHGFRAKVYVALNTLLTDAELPQAARLCQQLYALGADALIIQDLGLLELDLPPIALHSSTQMNNQSPEKVRFLEQVGFTQVVLARELSLQQIRAIREATTVRLESFVHGALCVSYSGQCYISEVMAGRSANRGECAQFCRHKYDVHDRRGRLLAHDRYLLSLKDLDLSQHLHALVQAGVDALKIEGRLKDISYVKNVTAAYRQALDRLLTQEPNLQAASAGRCQFAFTPDPARSFSRGRTEYFLNRRKNKVAEIRTPKSLGKKIGRVSQVEETFLVVEGTEPVHNGDGLCFFNQQEELVGLRINRVEGRRLFPKGGTRSVPLVPGQELFRNHDGAFTKQLEHSHGGRRIGLTLLLEESKHGLRLRCQDEDGIASSWDMPVEKQQATKPGSLEALAKRQLMKTGESIFVIDGVTVNLPPQVHVPVSVINALRRESLAHHLETRVQAFWPRPCSLLRNTVPWPASGLSYLDNITNSRARDFYRRHGVEEVAGQPLLVTEVSQPALMTTKYCLRWQLGLCPQAKGTQEIPAEPLFLSDGTGEYILEFQCDRCEMILKKKTGAKNKP